AEAGQAAQDGLVVAELTIAVQLHEVGEQAVDVVHEVRTLRVARDLGAHPRFQVGVGLGAHGVGLLAPGGDLGLERSAGRRQQRQLGDLGVQLGDRLFEFEIVRGHKASVEEEAPMALRKAAEPRAGNVPEQARVQSSFAKGWLAWTTWSKRSVATWV